jgi:methyltransferase family protein
VGKEALVTSNYQFLSLLHNLLQPRQYLEIGVQTGASLNLASCPAIGIDPAPLVAAREGQQIFAQASDDFFADRRFQQGVMREEHGVCPDLVYIDGMHLFEFALRDFINVERLSHPGTVVVFDDVMPYNEAIAARIQPPGDWTGDVWKVEEILRNERPDLDMALVDVSPTGALVVWNLDPTSTHLTRNYAEIEATYMVDVPPHSGYLDRSISTSVSVIVERLRQRTT